MSRKIRRDLDAAPDYKPIKMPDKKKQQDLLLDKRKKETEDSSLTATEQMQSSNLGGVLSSSLRSPYLSRQDALDKIETDVDKFFGLDPESASTLLANQQNTFPESNTNNADKADNASTSSLSIFQSVDSTRPASEISEVSVNALLTALAHKGDFDGAKRAFQLMKIFGIEPNVKLYTSLISATVKAKKPDEAFALLSEMKMQRIQPNTWTYNAVINACTKSGQLDRALTVLTLLKEDNLVPDQVIYTSLVHGCVALKDYQRAWEIFDTARLYSLLKPDEVTYTVMVNACAKTGEVERALKLVNEMIEDNMQPTEVTYTALIHACAIRPDYYSEAVQIFDRMKSDGLWPDAIAVNSLLHACEVNRDFQSAERIFLEMKQSGSYKLKVDTYTTLINTLARAQTWYSKPNENIEKVEALVKEMRNKKIYLNERTEVALLSAYTLAKQVERAEAKFRELYELQNREPNFYAYMVMLRMYSEVSDVDKLNELVKEIRSKGIKLDMNAYKDIIVGCARSNKIKTGVGYLKEMLKEKFKPDIKLVNPLIAKCHELGFPDAADQIKEMCGFRIKEKKIDDFVERNPYVTRR